jgi:hypothetical protein
MYFSFDLSGVSVAVAAGRTAGEDLVHVRFLSADLFQPPFGRVALILYDY